MIEDGKIALFQFPQTNQVHRQLRPALVLKRLPGPYDDWLVCMISTRLQHKIEGMDEIINPEDHDFKDSGLKSASLFRITRLAVVEKSILQGSIGKISKDRLLRIKTLLSTWMCS